MQNVEMSQSSGWGAPQFQPSSEQEAEWKATADEQQIAELLAPEPWPLSPEEVEERRIKVEEILGRPFPRYPRPCGMG